MDYDMAGLAYYDDGMGAWITPEMLKQHLMAAGAGAAGVLVASKVVNYLGDMIVKPQTEGGALTEAQVKSKKYYKGALSIVLGVLGGRVLYDRNRDAGMAVVGAVAGGGLAELVAYLAGAPESGASAGVPYLSTNLSGGGSGGLSSLDLAALEAAVSRTSPAFMPESFAGTVAQSRALSAPSVREESIAAYAPYLS